METYTIIWRASQESFDFTEVEIVKGYEPASSFGWVVLAIMFEYTDWAYAEQAGAIAAAQENGYELLDVVKGKLESVL